MKKIKNILDNINFGELTGYALLALLIIFFSCFEIRQVSGHSMEGTFHDQDYVLVDIYSSVDELQDLDVVIMNVTENDNFKCDSIIKRYYEEYSTDGLYVIGDNYTNSRDSRAVGELDKDTYTGKVVLNITDFFDNLFSFTKIFE